MELRCATFNVLADEYLGYGDYSHVDPELLVRGARTSALVQLIDDLNVDVVGLQEAEAPLVQALDETSKWQPFWSPKGRNKTDGCLTLVRNGIEVNDFETHLYGDQSGHVMQTVRIGRTIFANTHIKWAPDDDLNHAGVTQATELLDRLGRDRAAVIFADCNDRPNGPVRRLVEAAGFVNVCGDEPTAIVDKQLAAFDLLAVRGVTATYIDTAYNPSEIPSKDCPSDHIPELALVDIK